MRAFLALSLCSLSLLAIAGCPAVSEPPGQAEPIDEAVAAPLRSPPPLPPKFGAPQPEFYGLPDELVAAIEDTCRDGQTGALDERCVAAALSSDRDCDGLTFLEEVERGLDPFDPTDGPDRDCDGLPNAEDPDIDNDGIPNEDDPDVDDDLIPNDDDPDVDGDGQLNEVDFDVDGDFVLNRWDIDNDADGEPDPDDDDDDDAPEDCDDDDEGEDDGGESEAGGSDDDGSAPAADVPASAISTVSRLQSIGGAAAPEDGDECEAPSQAAKTGALRQAAIALGEDELAAMLAEVLKELEQQAEIRPAADPTQPQTAQEALDALIALLDEAVGDTNDPQAAADDFEDRYDGLAELFAIEEAQRDPLDELTELINALADNDSQLGARAQAEVVAAVAAEQPDEDLIESALDAVVLLATLEESGVDPGQAADVFVPLASATGGLSDRDVMASVVDATLRVSSDTGSSIRQTAAVIEFLAFVVDAAEVDALSESAGHVLQAANDRGVNPLDVLAELEESGADLSDGVSPDEAGAAAEAVSMSDK